MEKNEGILRRRHRKKRRRQKPGLYYSIKGLSETANTGAAIGRPIFYSYGVHFADALIARPYVLDAALLLCGMGIDTLHHIVFPGIHPVVFVFSAKG